LLKGPGYRSPWPRSSRRASTPQALALHESSACSSLPSTQAIKRELAKNPNKLQQLEAEAKKLRKELERFMQLVADGDAPARVAAEVKRRESRLQEIEEEQKVARVPPTVTEEQIRALCRDRLARYRELLHANTPVARQALRRLLPQPLRIRPVTVDGRNTLAFEGETVLGPLVEPLHVGTWRPHGEPPASRYGVEIHFGAG